MRKSLALLLSLVLALGVFAGVTAYADESTELTTISILGYERNVSENTKFSERDTYYVWQELEKMLAENGVKCEFEIIADSDQYRTTIQTRLASFYDIPDIFCGSLTTTVDLLDMADMGNLISMNEVLGTTQGPAYQFFFGGEGDAARQLLTDEQGNFWWLPRIQVNQLDGDTNGTTMCMCIRKDWLDDLNMTTPTTLDEFTAAIRAFQENDINGNGVKDEVIDADTSRFYTGMNLWFGIPTCENNSIGLDLTNGKAVSAWYTPAIKDYFTFVQGLVSEGLLSSDFIGTDTSDSAAISGNQIAAAEYYPVGTYMEATVIAGGDEDAYYIGIEPIKAVDGVEPFISEETPYLVYLRQCVSINAQDKLEAVAKFYDTIYSEAGINLMQNGVEGLTYDVNEDGTINKFYSLMSFSEKADAHMSGLDELARNFFPTLYHNERTIEMANKSAAGYPEKVDYEYLVAYHTPRTPNDNSGYYALATAEENMILDQYSTDLETASREIAAKLSLGEYSVDNMDTYIQQLKDVGLDEVLAVRQAQYDRAHPAE
ncbi:MAG: hypothetical protein ACI4P5_10600 [Candidatus Fimadaptatus sp.]